PAAPAAARRRRRGSWAALAQGGAGPAHNSRSRERALTPTLSQRERGPVYATALAGPYPVRAQRLQRSSGPVCATAPDGPLPPWKRVGVRATPMRRWPVEPGPPRLVCLPPRRGGHGATRPGAPAAPGRPAARAAARRAAATAAVARPGAPPAPAPAPRRRR